MGLYAVGPLLVAVVTLGFGLFVFISNPKAKRNLLFFGLCVSVFFWAFGYSQMYNAVGHDARALTWARFGYIGVPFIPVFVYHFIITLLELKPSRLAIYVVYSLGVVFLIISRTDFFLRGMYNHYFWGSYPKAGPLYITFVAFFAWMFVRMVLLLYGELRSRSAGGASLDTERIKYVLLGFAIASTSLVDYAPNYGIQVYPWGYLSALGWLICMWWASFRYRLMEIHLAITRTAVFVAVYALVLGLPLLGALMWQSRFEQWLGHRWWAWLWVIGVLLATVAHYANLHFQRTAEARLLREQHRYQATLLQASRGMTQIRDLKRLLNLVIHVLTRTIGLRHAAIFLEEEPEDTTEMIFLLKAGRHYPLKSSRLSQEAPLVKLLREARQPLVRDELRAHIGEDDKDLLTNKALAQIENLKASVVIPSFIQNRLGGFLVLGEKRTGQIFTSEDLTVLATLANQAAVAIESARFYETEKERQAALFHSATLASLGTMASSMGHQINNRFHILTLTGQTQTEKLRLFLQQNVQDPVALRKMLEENLSEFESVLDEAVRGGQVVADIRTLINPSTTDHKPIAIADAIQAGLRVVKYKVPFDKFDYHEDLPEELPQVRGSVSQLGECFLNLIDNAWYAIGKKAKDLKQPDYRGMIWIKGATTTIKDHPWIVIEVVDNGMGMTDNELKHCFDPFFTTKASAEIKGTGLGLFVIRKIVGAHGGIIMGASTHGVGTTFTIRLPAV